MQCIEGHAQSRCRCRPLRPFLGRHRRRRGVARVFQGASEQHAPGPAEHPSQHRIRGSSQRSAGIDRAKCPFGLWGAFEGRLCCRPARRGAAIAPSRPRAGAPAQWPERPPWTAARPEPRSAAEWAPGRQQRAKQWTRQRPPWRASARGTLTSASLSRRGGASLTDIHR